MTAPRNATRRDLFGLVAGAAVAASVPGIAAAASVPVAATTGPNMVVLAREWFSLNSAIDGVDSDGTARPLLDRMSEIEDQLTAGKASSPAEAIAALEVARADMVRFKFGGVAYSEGGDGGYLLALTAIDNALRVLRLVEKAS